MKPIILSLLLFQLVAFGQTNYTPGITWGASPPNTAPPAAPSFFALVQTTNENTALSTTTFVLVTNIPTLNRAVVSAATQSSVMGMASVADSRLNTWTVSDSISAQCGDGMSFGQATAAITTALQIGDTITVTWAAPVQTARMGAVAYMTNCAAGGQPDTHKQGAICNNATVTAPANTTAANTVQYGTLLFQDGTSTYSGGNWTTIGSVFRYSGNSMYFVTHQSSSAGSQDPGGTLSSPVSSAFLWYAFK